MASPVLVRAGDDASVVVWRVAKMGRLCCSGRWRSRGVRAAPAGGGSMSGGASAHVLCFYVLFWFAFLPINQIIGIVVLYFPRILQLKKELDR
jgi:hypothetical protein